MPFFKGKIVLLRQYRHALQDFQYAILRGFGEKEIADADNVDKELEEEIGAKVLKKEKIGTVVADSGMNGNKVSVFWCEVSEPVLKEKYEGIERLKLVTEEEMEEMIANREIDDGFTLSAYCFYQMWKKGTCAADF